MENKISLVIIILFLLLTIVSADNSFTLQSEGINHTIELLSANLDSATIKVGDTSTYLTRQSVSPYNIPSSAKIEDVTSS